MPFQEQPALQGFFEEKDKNALGDPRAQRIAQDTGAVDFQQEDNSSLLLSSFKDVALAVPRGVAGFGRSLVGLANTVPGLDIDLGDKRLFGESETIVGGLAEGIVQFGLGFLPGLGLASRIGKLGALSGTAKTAFSIGGRFKMNIPPGGFAAAGAVADFTAFEGNEERLSNILQSVPALQNPITDFLAAREEDDEITGRLKNVMEGLALGGIADLLIAGLKGVKASRLKALDDTPETVARLIDDANGPGEVQSALDDAFEFGKGAPDEEAQGLDELIGDRGLEDVPDPISLPDAGAPEGRAKIMAEDLGMEPKDIEDVAMAYEGSQARATVDPRNNPRDLTPLQRVQNDLSTKSQNLSKTILTEDAAHVYRAHEDLLSAAERQAEQGRVPIAEEMAEAASIAGDMMGADPLETFEKVRASVMSQIVEGTPSEIARQMRIRMVAISTVAQASTNQYVKLIDNALAANDPAAFAKAQQFVNSVEQLRQEGRKLRGESGRTQRILQELPSNELADGSNAVAQSLFNSYGADENQIKALFEKMKAAHGQGGIANAAAVLKIHDMTFGRKFWGIMNEVYTNNLLGAMTTQAVNVISGLTNSIILPMEQMMGGAIMGNKDVMQSALGEMMSLSNGVAESFRFGWKAAKEGRGFIDPANNAFDDFTAGVKGGRMVQANTFGQADDTLTGKSINWIGGFVNIPTTIMRGTDEFVKQLNGRAVVRNGLMQEAISSGKRGVDVGKHVEEGFSKVIHEGQLQTEAKVRTRGVQDAKAAGLTDPGEINVHVKKFVGDNFKESMSDNMEQAVKRFQEATLQTPLDPDSLSGRIQTNILMKHPWTRMVVPFFKTPVNIATAVGQRADMISPVRQLMSAKFGVGTAAVENSRMRFLQDLNSGSATRKAEAIGRITTGTGLMGTGLMLSMQGLITGRGPTDKELRNSMMDAGWQPYSIRTPNGFVQYLKMDPYASFFGLMADLNDTMRLTENEDTEIPQVMNAVLVSLANNLTQRSYLQGVGNVLDAFSDPQRNMANLVEQYAGAAVPNTLAQLIRMTGDNNYADTNGMMERIISRTPFMSDSVRPMRNALGEPISRGKTFSDDPIGGFYGMFVPLAYREVSDDTIRREFFDLQFGFSPPRAKVAGLDFREFDNGQGQDAYDRWQELQGEVKIGGRSLRQELKKLMGTSQYKRLDPQSGMQGPSPRVNLIRSVIGRYRQEAQDEMLTEYPELRKALGNAERERAALLQGARAGREQQGGFISTTIGNL